MRHSTTWATRGRWGTRLLTGVLVAGVLGCGADSDPGGGSDTDTGTDRGTGTGAESGRSPGPEAGDDPCSPEPDPSREHLPRMCAVADAWEGSEAARRWIEEFQPLDSVVQLPEGGLRGEKDVLAYENGSFRALTALPEERVDGAIRWEDGETRPVSLMSAADAFGEMSSGIADSSPGFDALEVTGVASGEMRVRTSRGPAQVPAWLFTLDGYDTPLRHAAVPFPEPLAAPVDQGDGGGGELRGLEALGEVSEDGRRVTVTWWNGSCTETAFDVLETEESVVLAAWIAGGPPEGTVCTAEVRIVRKTLELERPLGERAPLDAFSGEVLQPGPPEPAAE
ncbi:hypothetical protein ACTWP5_28560 [Streptomyces sp. 4N509B]|uniref:hypothetical protein n=1 Tax=Streptomyces sp. 4N509B TaxID=3457413 RepID=UPI003FD4D67A